MIRSAVFQPSIYSNGRGVRRNPTDPTMVYEGNLIPLGQDKYPADSYIFDGVLGEVKSRSGLIYRPGTIGFRDAVYDLWNGYYAASSFPTSWTPFGLTYNEKLNQAFKAAYDKGAVAETERPMQLQADGTEKPFVSDAEKAVIDTAAAKGESPPKPAGYEDTAPEKQPDPDKKPITEKVWFYPTIAGGVILMGAIGYYVATRRK